MTPDPEQRLPRELLKELIEEGSDAFRGVLEKLLNTAMQMEREEFLGARRWERSEQRRDHANGYKAKTLSTRVGQLQIRIPQVRHLDFYPRSLERGVPLGESPEAGHRRDVRDGRVDAQGH